MTAHFVGTMRIALAAVSFFGRVDIFSGTGTVFREIDEDLTTVYANQTGDSKVDDKQAGRHRAGRNG